MTEQPEAYELINSLLNLSGVKVVGIIDSPANNKITIQVESTQSPINCRQCGKPTRPHGSARTVTLRPAKKPILKSHPDEAVVMTVMAA